MHKTFYCVGIDLGTTNTVVSYVRLNKQGQSTDSIKIFPIDQLVAPGTVAPRLYLPSLRYHPLEDELSLDQCKLPWNLERLPGEPKAIFGEWAQLMARQTEGRGVLSAKSWLCHHHIDRWAPILPWGHTVEVEKISPVLAQASLLNYCRQAWDHANPDCPLAQQSVVITVPASFDESARALTQKAATLAGLGDVALLEEPHAACYDWLSNHREDLSSLDAIRLLMVLDVGGGTSDFSLMAVKKQGRNNIAVDRIAVGDHLMLGGDNIDLAISLKIEQALGRGQRRTSATELNQIQQHSQWAKEQLLQADAPEEIAVTLLGRGSSLLQKKQTINIARADVEAIVFEQFLATTPWGDLPQLKRAGVVEYGLPYESDACFSKHICHFLQRNQRVCRENLGIESGVALPDGLLLNGGFFQADATRNRVVELIQHWSTSPEYAVNVLSNVCPNQAVARGAVAFQLAKRGEILAIGGGAPRDYWLVVGNRFGEQEAVCILPKGSPEGLEQTLPDQEFEVLTGEPVQFLLLTTDQNAVQCLGDRASVPVSARWLPPMYTEVDQFERHSKVTLSSTYSELGTLQVALNSVDSDVQRSLDFDLRSKSYQSSLSTSEVNDAMMLARTELISHWHSRGVDIKALKGVRSQIEKKVGSRDQWDIDILRYLADGLIPLGNKRRRSGLHEQQWLNWLGFCLRPGVGHNLDPWRLERLWSLWGEGPHFPRQRQNWVEWWTFWRRICSGLSAHQQRTIFESVAPLINPANLKRRSIQTEVKEKGYESIVRMVGRLEKLSVENKEMVGSWLLHRLSQPKPPDVCWWALGAIGSRIMLFGGGHLVLAPTIVESWITKALEQDWTKKTYVAHAVVTMSRRCGSREHDISDACRELVLHHLTKAKVSPLWVDMVEQVIPLSVENSNQMLGESLPEGLLIA